MKAILIIPEQEETPCPSVACLALFPLMGRPFLQHVVEALAGAGITDVQIVLGEGAGVIEPFLGDGSRWGCSFSYHLLGDPRRPTSVLRALSADDGPVVIACADQLPQLPRSFSESGTGMLIGTPGDWSGWAVVNARDLMRARAGTLTELSHYLASLGLNWVSGGRRVVLRSLSDVPAAQEHFLRAQVTGALTSAREVRPGVWLARNVQIAASSKLEPPVFVGENTIVGDGVRVGPFAVVGANCLLDRDAGVRDTTVCTGTYVGSGVELDGVIVDGNSLINPRRQTVTTIDSRLLDRLAPVLSLPFALGRVLAAAAFVLAVPVLIASALWLWLTRPGAVFWSRQFVRAPATASEPAWEVGTVYTLTPPRLVEQEYGWIIPPTFRGLVLELLPALACVATGSLRLVGIPPRTSDLLRAHGARCPSLLRASPGLITELALCDRERLTHEDCLVVDAYQTQTSGVLANLKRIGRFLFQALRVWGKPSPKPTLVDANVIPVDQRSSAHLSDRLTGPAPRSIAAPPAAVHDRAGSDRSAEGGLMPGVLP